MPRPTDIRVVEVALHLLPVQTRVPLKFGSETLTEVTCARVRLRVVDRLGRSADGWGETPLSVQWAWPSGLSVARRLERMTAFCGEIARAWTNFGESGHAIELGDTFLESVLPGLVNSSNLAIGSEPLPRLAALICASAFDLALHDAFGMVHEVPSYQTYNARYLDRDLSTFLDDAPLFQGRFPGDFLEFPRADSLVAWHLVGGKDAIDSSELTGDEPIDGYPVLLRDWIRRDGLSCLKVKLRGDDSDWDFDRIVRVSKIAEEEGVSALSIDFNCTVSDPEYVNAILDHLRLDNPRAFQSILYVEQPFPYDLEANQINVRGVSSRKPLFMDESAHDWRLVRLGRELGWTGVALKTCKTQTGALLSLCWAKARGMALMVQDLTNPMLAQIPHVLLAAHAGTIMGVETNAMQFYPEASAAEAVVHPGLYRRRNGRVRLDSIEGPGFGYRSREINRELPAPLCSLGG